MGGVLDYEWSVACDFQPLRHRLDVEFPAKVFFSTELEGVPLVVDEFEVESLELLVGLSN